MVGVLWAAAILLGVAGLGKLLRPAPTSRAVIAAEIPGASVLSALPVVRLLGLLEVVIAGVVLGVGGALPAALLAVGYLLLAVVAWRMIRLAPGQDCGCFGTSSEPSSWSHVIVNAAAAIVGLLAVILPAAVARRRRRTTRGTRPSAARWVNAVGLAGLPRAHRATRVVPRRATSPEGTGVHPMTALIVVETVILLVLCVLVAGLLRAYATVLQRLHALDGGEAAASSGQAPPFRTVGDIIAPPVDLPPPGGRDEWPPAHDISGEGLTGEIVSVRTVAVPHDTVLVFLSSGCAGCTGFWEQLADRPRRRRDGRPADRGGHQGPGRRERRLCWRELCPPGVDLVMSSTAWADYEVPGSPYVVVVDGHTGRVKGEGSGHLPAARSPV